MQVTGMDAALLRKCFLAAAANVEKNKEYINELNVFPVPDGDTGTNVSMTLMSAVSGVRNAQEEIPAICREISAGTLRGARGNSGVIFSQLLRGFTKAVREKDVIRAEDLAAGFRRAQETAYKAVMKPKEGTILTVARGMSDRMEELASEEEDLAVLAEKVVEYGTEVLNRTPEMLPVLKEAGVVDSGGMALMVAMKGALAALTGKEEEILGDTKLKETAPEAFAEGMDSSGAHTHLSTEEIRFGYCTECIVNLYKRISEQQVEDLKNWLLSMGDSVVCVEDEGVVKIHVHTDHPGLVFEKGLEFGSLSALKIDNMREEHEERLRKEAAVREGSGTEREPSREKALVAVCAGEELAAVFYELGADVVIEGGQTMNPSIADILTACEKADAREVFVLPNNKNIILASQQAGNNTGGRFRIITVPTKTVVQGITAVMSFDRGLDTGESLAAMEEAVSRVKSGEVTYAIRNTCLNGMEIHEGDIMGISDSGILAAGRELNGVTLDMIGKMTDPESSLISVFYGSDVTGDTAESLAAELVKRYPMLDVDVSRGGQPVYYYFVSVE